MLERVATIFRLKGAILNISFLDPNGQILALNPLAWKDRSRASEGSTSSTSGTSNRSLNVGRGGSGSQAGGSAAGPSGSKMIPKISPTTSAIDFRESHFVVITSEKQARLMVLPMQVCGQKATITETSFAVRADVVNMKGHGKLN